MSDVGNGYVTWKWLAGSVAGFVFILFGVIQAHADKPHADAYSESDARVDLSALEDRINTRLDRIERKIDRVLLPGR